LHGSFVLMCFEFAAERCVCGAAPKAKRERATVRGTV
jgi:hypothetical protein